MTLINKILLTTQHLCNVMDSADKIDLNPN